MINTKIHNCNNELLEQQKSDLTNEIINGNNSNYFKVFDLEAGTGKTRTAEYALAQFVLNTDKNAIVVRLNNKDCQETADNINAIVGENVAIAFNNEAISKSERKQKLKDLHNYRIVVITHPKYIVLAQDNRKRITFTKNRSVLVIDEFISCIKKLTLNIKDINTLKLLFKDDIEIQSLFSEIVAILEDFVIANPTERFPVRLTSTFPTKKINLLIKYILNNITKDYLEHQKNKISNCENTEDINIDLLKSFSTVKQLCNYIEQVKEFYKRMCILDNGTLYTTDSRCNYWFLDNNIMLDASGALQMAYSVNEQLYKLSYNPKVLDHSSWTLINIVANTTTAGKERITNFYDEVDAIVREYGADDTLVIGNKSDVSNISCVSKDNKAYFGNITGSNKWSDLKNVMVIQTPNLNDIDYILQCLHYAKDYIDKTFTKWTSISKGRNINSRYQFTDYRLERIRVLWIAEQIYQAIKRVNRSMNYATNAVVIINNDDVINLLKEHLKGCTVKTIDRESFEFKYTKQDEYIGKLQDNSYATKFMDLLAELKYEKHPELLHKDKLGEIINGTYKKQTIREYLGISSAKDFNNKVLSKTQVITYCKVRNISLNGQFIKLTAYSKDMIA